MTEKNEFLPLGHILYEVDAAAKRSEALNALYGHFSVRMQGLTEVELIDLAKPDGEHRDRLQRHGLIDYDN
jgi:hypothetical protein